MSHTILEFPPYFLFGSATAAHQVEGDSGARSTDWDVFFKNNPGIVHFDEKGPEWWLPGKAERDIESMASLHLKVQRISLSWGRIEPEKGKINLEAVERYKEIIQNIINSGMSPMVTLNHYALPQWVAREGSWTNKRIIGHFEHYVKFAVLEFPEVKYWLTLNEPNILVIAGYLTRYYPPGKNNIFSAFMARWNMLEAHRRAYKKIKKINPAAKVSMTLAFRWNMPEHLNSKMDKWYSDIVNFLGVGSYIHATKHHLDFIGCNFYTGYYLDLNFRKIKLQMRRTDMLMAKTLLFGETREPDAYKSDYGWPIVPEFFLDVLRRLNKSFHLPIIITENGIADRKDKHRAFYIIVHLVVVWKAIQEGMQIDQYIHWSTIDNLEWLEGYTKDFGLIDLNPITGGRHLRESANLYKEIAKNRKIDVEYLCEKYLKGEQKEKAYEIITKLLSS